MEISLRKLYTKFPTFFFEISTSIPKCIHSARWCYHTPHSFFIYSSIRFGNVPKKCLINAFRFKKKKQKQKDKQGSVKWKSLVVFSKCAGFQVLFIFHLNVSKVRLLERLSEIDFQRIPEAVEYNLIYLCCFTPFTVGYRVRNRHRACSSC